MGCAGIDSFTVRQTTERSQRDLAASGMFFNHQGCDSPKSRTELPVGLCKGDRQERSMRGERRDLGTLSCDTRGDGQYVSGKRAHSLPLGNGGVAASAETQLTTRLSERALYAPVH